MFFQIDNSAPFHLCVVTAATLVGSAHRRYPVQTDASFKPKLGQKPRQSPVHSGNFQLLRDNCNCNFSTREYS